MDSQQSGTGSSLMNIGSSIVGGNSAEKAKRYQAKQVERNATAKRAQGSRQTQELLRQGDKLAL